MSYQPRPNASGDTLAASRDPIRNNFITIQTAFELNHVAYGDPNEGKHKFMQMPEQASAPTTAANEIGLYAKADPSATGQSALFYRQESDGDEYIMTTSKTSDFANFGFNTSGWTFLPGGLLLQWGSYTQSSSSSGTAVVFSTPFSVAPYSLTTNLNRDSGAAASIGVSNLTTTGFKGRSSASGNHTAYYMAIGKA